MGLVKHEYLVVNSIAEAEIEKTGSRDFGGAIVGVYPTRAEARKMHSELGGAVEAYEIVQITTIVIEKRIR